MNLEEFRKFVMERATDPSVITDEAIRAAYDRHLELMVRWGEIHALESQWSQPAVEGK